MVFGRSKTLENINIVIDVENDRVYVDKFFDEIKKVEKVGIKEWNLKKVDEEKENEAKIERFRKTKRSSMINCNIFKRKGPKSQIEVFRNKIEPISEERKKKIENNKIEIFGRIFKKDETKFFDDNENHEFEKLRDRYLEEKKSRRLGRSADHVCNKCPKKFNM
jgi:hypothetical protein